MNETISVLPPPAGLKKSVVCCIWREIGLSANEKTSQETPIPANVYGSINLISLGSVALNSNGLERLPNQFITGPFTAPLPTFTSIPLRSLTIVVQPWVLRDWFWIDASSLVNAIQDIELLQENSPWRLIVGKKIMAAVDHSELLGEVLAGLGMPDSQMPERINPELLTSGLIASGSVASAAQSAGLSERQFERRFKMHMGLSPKLWLRIKRFEGALISVADQPGDLNALGGIAADTGFYDQAHMSNEFRAISGDTPLSMQKGLNSNSPGYCAFQPAKVGFLKDSHPCKNK